MFSSDSYTWVYSPIAHEFCKTIWKFDGWIPRETTVHNFFMRNIPPPSTHQRKMKQTRKNSSEIDEANLPRDRTKMCWRIPSGLVDGSLVPYRNRLSAAARHARTHAACFLSNLTRLGGVPCRVPSQGLKERWGSPCLRSFCVGQCPRPGELLE